MKTRLLPFALTVGLCTQLTLVLLKLLGFVTWSWHAVALPFWIGAGLAGVLILIFAFIGWAAEWLKGR